MRRIFLSLVLISLSIARQAAAQPAPTPSSGDAALTAYLKAETEKIAARCLTHLNSQEDWTRRREEYRKQLLDMLGLDPMPERTDLKPVVTGTLDHPEFTVEKLYFQSRPGLYVTGNLYVPKNIDKPVPAVLYVCGHAQVKKGDVSLGNKTFYQHHGIWFARNGYVCLVIDSVQLGEIPGIHHGLYRENLWWWLDRGYTPAGAEAWNCVRAIDYLQTRKEVDPKKIGVTGRSGGGAYSWWIAAIDDRITTAAPTAGITDLEDHVVNGCVEGHCDCMYIMNTYLWDYPQVAALVAPRPLLLVNTDKDGIFPLGGVMRTHDKVRHVFDLLGARKEFAPTIGEGDHKDTQELQVAVFRWFNRKLKGVDPVIDKPAIPMFEPERLRVFEPGKEPADAINGRVHEVFVPMAPKPEVATTKEHWAKQRNAWMSALREKCFRSWPSDGPTDKALSTVLETEDGIQLSVSAEERRDSEKESPVELRIGRVNGSRAAEGSDAAVRVDFQPRSIANADVKVQTHLLRRFALLGRTLESTQVWDVRCAIRAARGFAQGQRRPLRVRAEGTMAGVALYASLFEPGVNELRLSNLPPSHVQGPHFLNVLRVLDMPQAVAMAAERSRVVLESANAADWAFAVETAKTLGWERNLETHPPKPD